MVSPEGFHVIGDAGQIETQPLHLDHRQTFALDYRPEYEADAKLMVGVLSSAFEGDDPHGQTELWWQAMGAALFDLMPRLQLALLLLGRERSGKSLLQRVLERAFPAAAVGAVSPSSWGHEYHVATLAGKRLNVVGELSDDAPIPAAAFKNDTGQNLVSGRVPDAPAVQLRMAARVCVAATTAAAKRSMNVAASRHTVAQGSVDRSWRSEMPAILASAFLGAQQVARAGGIRTTLAHDAVMERWRAPGEPAATVSG